MNNKAVQSKQRYDRVINGLFLFLFFIAPLSRAGINIVAPILTIVWLIKKIKFRKDPDERFTYPEILKWIGILGITVLLSFINVKNFSAAIKNFVDEYILLGSIFIIGLDVIRSQEQLRKLLWAGVSSLLIVAGWGIYEYFGLGHSRIESTFSVATQTGVYFAGVVLLVLAFLLFRKARNRSAFIGASILLFLNLLCLIMTGTRAAWLGFFAGAAFLLFLALKRNKVVSLKKLIVVFVIIILAAMFIDIGWIFDRLASITDLSNSSNHQRIMMLLSGLEMLKDHPLTGVGIGQFRFVYADYLMEGAFLYTHIHFLYLHLAVELGLIGFSAFLILVYKVLKAGILATHERTEEKSWFHYGVLGALIGIAVCNVFDWTFLNLQIGTFTLILVAMWLNKIKRGFMLGQLGE